MAMSTHDTAGPRRTRRGLSARFDLGVADGVVLIALSMIAAAGCVLGVSYVAGQGWHLFGGFTTFVLFTVATIAFLLAFLFVDEAVFRLAAHPRRGTKAGCAARIGALLVRITPRYTVRSVAAFSLVMALLWLPWLIANYPGGTYWDTYYQMFQCYPENHPIAIIPYAECYDNTLTDAYLCDHHPIFDTLVYGAFAIVSDMLTGNWMAGVFAFVCVQGAAHVVAFTAAVAYLRARGCPAGVCFFAYAFFCVMPFISTWALCMVKDSLFGLFYVPYFIMLFEIVRTRGLWCASKRAVALFVLVGVMLCLTKKTGLYVVVPTAVVAAVVYRRWWKELAVQALSCVVLMCVIFPLVVFPLLNVAPGGKQEVLGVLFQQTARHVTYYGYDVTEEERATIDKVLEFDNLADQYTYNFQDEVKYRFNLDATNEDLLNYLRVWAAQGLRHPESYVASVMSIAGYYVAPCGVANIRMVTVDTHMDGRYMLYNPQELAWLRTGMADAYDAMAYTPVLDAPLLIVVYAFWLPLALVFVACHRRVRCGVLFVPAFVLLAFCIIAPVYDARYCVPIFNGAPLMLCAVIALLRAQRTRHSAALPPCRTQHSAEERGRHAAGQGAHDAARTALAAPRHDAHMSDACACGADDAVMRPRGADDVVVRPRGARHERKDADGSHNLPE